MLMMSLCREMMWVLYSVDSSKKIVYVKIGKTLKCVAVQKIWNNNDTKFDSIGI
jgi:hypothetical protein